MEWFKWLLVGLFSLTALSKMYTAGGGNQAMKSEPVYEIIGAILYVLLVLGTIFWL